MKNLVAKESIEAVAVKEENIMETQIVVGKEAFSKEVVLRNIAQKDISLQKLLGYRNYDFYDPKLFMLGLKDGETISEALLRRGAYNIGQVKTRSTRYKNCYTDYFMYPDNESTVVAVVYNNEGVGIPTLLDYEDYAKYFKDENLTLNDRHDNTRLYENPMPMVKIKSRIRVSRLVLGIEDAYRGIQADHINSNRFDNRKENLRKTTNKQNSNNRPNSKNRFESCAYDREADYRFGMAILLERDFFRSMSKELASVYNQFLLEHFSPISYSIAS